MFAAVNIHNRRSQAYVSRMLRFIRVTDYKHFTLFSGQVTDYLITSEVRGDNSTKSRLTQIIRYVQVPLFQFGVFYGKGVDLEIAPGANMTFNGRVHANSNLYVGAGASHD